MLDREYPDLNMCGPIAYDYTYLQGLKDNYLNAFEVCVDMYTDNTNNLIYEAISRAILTRHTSRVLTFHSGVTKESESNTNVWNFVDEPEFIKAFHKIQKAEFPKKKGYYTKFTFKGIDGTTPSSQRKIMLSELDDTPDNEIYIISSCETIGKFYISDSTKKWSQEPLTTENGGSLLRTLLIDNGFTIISEDIGLPFVYLYVIKYTNKI